MSSAVPFAGSARSPAIDLIALLERRAGAERGELAQGRLKQFRPAVHGPQRELARLALLAAPPRRRGHGVRLRVLPVVQPAHEKTTAVRRVVEGNARVVVLSPVEPRRVVREAIVPRVLLEARPVEVTNVGRGQAAAPEPARVRADEHHPLAAGGVAVDVEREQAGHLVLAALRRERPPLAQERPRPEICRGVDRHLVIVRQRDRHHPPFGRLVPEDVRVAELARPDVDDRIPGVKRERAALVEAVRKRLRLVPAPSRRVDRHHRRMARRPEAARVLRVDDDTAREDALAVGLARDRDGELLPVQQVRADGVPPDDAAARSGLIEKMPLAGVVHESVRIVHEQIRLREVKLRPPRLLIEGIRLRRRPDGRAAQQQRGRRGKCAGDSVHRRSRRRCRSFHCARTPPNSSRRQFARPLVASNFELLTSNF